MNNMILKGITWDHPRGYAPLYASADRYKKLTGVEIIWSKHSLKDFGDTSIQALSENYDLLIIDHPHIGIAATSQCLLKLDALMSSEELNLFALQSVGPSFFSYNYQNHQWALPIDAACQVASYRSDLFIYKIPETWNEVFSVANNLKQNKKFIGTALCATDCNCTFLTLSAQHNDAPKENKSDLVNKHTGVKILQLISKLKDVSHPDSLKWNPINLYDHMISNDDVVYSPLAFGYVNYSTNNNQNHFLKYAGIPGKTGSLLGGAGIAISSKCKNIIAAIEYIKWICDPEYQKTKYVEEGGQPGQLKAWKDKTVNAFTNNFFADTLSTIETAYVRPRMPGWPAFQEYLGNVVHDFLLYNKNAEMIIDELNNAYKKMKSNYK